jgi:DnaJ domain
MGDLYEVLQLHHTAEPEIIEAAYRRLARKYHPDVNQSPDAAARMAAISSAYKVLSDPAKRAEYDRWRASLQGNVGSLDPSQQRPVAREPVLVQPAGDWWLGPLIVGFSPVSLIFIAIFRFYASSIIGTNGLWLNLLLLPPTILAVGVKVWFDRGRPLREQKWVRFGAACLTAAVAANLYTWLTLGLSGLRDWFYHQAAAIYWFGLLFTMSTGFGGLHLLWGRLSKSVRRFLPRKSPPAERIGEQIQ